MKYLVNKRYLEAEPIRFVQDNLNAHKAASLYEAFPPEEPRRILKWLEFHHKPKHGSWLNIVEIELNVFNSHCLDRRIGDKESLIAEVTDWDEERNQRAVDVNWQFTTSDARIKLKRLYLSFQA